MTVTFPLKVSDFDSHKAYYNAYQRILTRDYLIPVLREWEAPVDGIRLLDIGCGTGGLLDVFAENEKNVVVGVEIVPDMQMSGDDRIHYFVGDIFDEAVLARVKAISDQYDLIVCRDVIEHIHDKAGILKIIASLLSDRGKAFFVFPPYYAPFGAHQQAIMKSALRKVPYLHLLYKPFYFWLCSRFEKVESLGTLRDIYQTRCSFPMLRRLARKAGLVCKNRRFFLIRPTYQIRFGIKPVRAFWGRVPLISQLLVTGIYCLFGKNSTSDS